MNTALLFALSMIAYIAILMFAVEFFRKSTYYNNVYN